MPRPQRCRRVNDMPRIKQFNPETRKNEKKDEIIMTIDEYETIRIIDYEEKTQEECAKSMEVGRTTVQQIYNNARNKIAKSIVEGRPLFIKGGCYKISNETGRRHRNCNEI